MTTTSEGAEVWACAVCGRRIRLRWPPHYERTVLHSGDESICHPGVHLGVRGPGERAGPTHDERAWLREHGIEWGDPYDICYPP
ncbi:hypothetical protein [Spongiactinospora sp. TRM90649]|uniref:hypothetical protein n=1 Tax=Spongiactinospora sp. TRM90649 TaxID=3031114 RepID=UPI0023F8A162|nr:hypothetical protein [Spongiactinospora sp. TRM90649]MDF5754138.1 hypothetical protein [Spongiactinospora sp. TRM90649]